MLFMLVIQQKKLGNYKMLNLVDRKFRIPRIWSNKELKRLCQNFSGKAINVSGWLDSDKEGSSYKNYFENIEEYYISNYESAFKGFQGNNNEILLNLENDIDGELINKFDVVFNHTALEHIFDFQKAFYNLCLMSKDVVVVVVPFIQEQHAEKADYNDYWRFTPIAVKKMYELNNLDLIYLNYNDVQDSSIYIVAIGSKNPGNWKSLQTDPNNKLNDVDTRVIGKKIIVNSIFFKIKNLLKRYIK